MVLCVGEFALDGKSQGRCCCRQQLRFCAQSHLLATAFRLRLASQVRFFCCHNHRNASLSGCTGEGVCDGQQAECPGSSNLPNGHNCAWSPPADGPQPPGYSLSTPYSAKASGHLAKPTSFPWNIRWDVCQGACHEGECSLQLDSGSCCQVLWQPEDDPHYTAKYRQQPLDPHGPGWFDPPRQAYPRRHGPHKSHLNDKLYAHKPKHIKPYLTEEGRPSQVGIATSHDWDTSGGLYCRRKSQDYAWRS